MGREKLNLDINDKDKTVSITINPKIYPMDVIYSAGYVLMEDAYVVIDGDPETKIIVDLSPKEDKDLENLGLRFNEELLNYAMYRTQSEKNAPIRQMILQRVLLTNGGIQMTPDAQAPDMSELDEEDEDAYFDDPEGIAIPWEEKYGKDKK